MAKLPKRFNGYPICTLDMLQTHQPDSRICQNSHLPIDAEKQQYAYCGAVRNKGEGYPQYGFLARNACLKSVDINGKTYLYPACLETKKCDLLKLTKSALQTPEIAENYLPSLDDLNPKLQKKCSAERG